MENWTYTKENHEVYDSVGMRSKLMKDGGVSTQACGWTPVLALVKMRKKMLGIHE